MPAIRNNGLSCMLFALAFCDSWAGSTRSSSVDVQQSDIAPSLHPTSDKKFFDKDYPEDTRPGIANHFDVPFPLVQDAEDFDKDFVQDENEDAGYWTAQMEYDALKNRLARERVEMNRAKQKMEEEKHDYEFVSGKEAESERATQVLEEDAERASDAAAAKEDAAAEAKRHDAASAENVDTKVKNLKKCEDELRVAKEELEKILEKLKAAEKTSLEAADKADTAEADVEAAEKEEADWEEKLAKADEAHKATVTKYEEKTRQLTALEANLADAAKILAKYRAPKMDSKGGVVDDKSTDTLAFHSDGLRTEPVAQVVTAAALCMWAAF